MAGASWPPQSFLNQLYEGLSAQGFRISLACAERPDPAWLKRNRMQWISTPRWDWKPAAMGSLALRFLTALIKHPGSLFRLTKIIRRTRPGFRETVKQWHLLLPFTGKKWDMIYFPWNWGAITYLKLFDLEIPVIVSCRGSDIYIAPHDPRYPEMAGQLRETFEKAAGVHCVSDAIVKEAVKYGLDPARARVIRPAVDPKKFCPVEKTRSAKQNLKIISIGNLLKVKGYEHALKAMRQLKDQNIPFDYEIIGQGKDRELITQAIKDLKLTSCVVLTGQLEPSLVREKLCNADVFLLSSLSEGISNAALEAMACGLPVITTDCGGMREAITDGIEGIVVPVGNSRAMADALTRLANDPDLRSRMGLAGRARIINQFNLETQIESFVSFFQSCLAAAPLKAAQESSVR